MVFESAPTLHCPQFEQRPVQANLASFLGTVLWYIVCMTFPSSVKRTALMVVEPMSTPKNNFFLATAIYFP